MTWWQRPIGVVEDHGELAHELIAQERLQFVNDVAAGFGNMKRHAHQRHMRALRRAASGRASRRRAPELTRSGAIPTRTAAEAAAALDPAKLVALGIGMVFQDKTGKEHATAAAAKAANVAADELEAANAGADG